MKELESENSKTWSGDRNLRTGNVNIDKKVGSDEANNNKNKNIKFKKYGTFLLLGALTIIAISLVALIAGRSTHNPVLLYIQGVFPPLKESENGNINPKNTVGNGENRQQFIEKDGLYIENSHFRSVSDLYFNRLLATPLSKMSLTIPINDELIRSYQIKAIDYNKNGDMTFHLSLGHSLKINNDTMILVDDKMNVINKLPTYIEEQNSNKSDINKNAENNPDFDKSLEAKLRKNDEGRRLQQEYYNYTSTTEWSHKPQIVNNIIPTYYPRNPYVPPYGNPYYYAPNILVPFVYIY
ncbi:hypothetical protein RS030_5695 [Cryptosporidium xiaoi]|uniref:Uncharacterized protein n=1 Tax=Cryptosporidium xiaoi TaxID=659607 RepID=A0AAV9XUN3_9CRYT